MRRSARSNAELVRVARAVLSAFARLPVPYRVGLLALLALAGLTYWVVTHRPAPVVAPPTGVNPDGSGTFLFCFWNVENLFDDRDDDRREIDEAYDNPFAAEAALREQKLDHLADALLQMNSGKGPDVLACCEVESVRAAELLQAKLNQRLDAAHADPNLHYTQVAMKNVNGGRHIAPCVITRLNVAHTSTQLHGRLLRILETRLVVNGHELALVASHWTSQLTQRDGSNGASGRDKYAALVHDVYADLVRRDPAADFLACGDFNCAPDSDPITSGLHATADRSNLLPPNAPPRLLNLFAGKPADQYGTLWYGGKPLIYDQICVSPGMLDGAGWGCDPDSARTVTAGLTRPGTTRREPWRFGDPARPPVGGRGFSDHFPVTVTLKLRPPA